MVRWSLSIGSVKGTEIRVHFTFLLFIMWLGTALYAQGGPQTAANGLAFILLLFACVVLHEFGHILMARRFGIGTRDVVLLPIGGMSRLEQIPEAPSQELQIALAGPAVSIVLAFLFAMSAQDIPTAVEFPASDAPGLMAQLAAANLMLAAFNLLPAFPMDGGRVLRALLAARLGHARGTRIAASAGQIFAIFFGLIGLVFGHAVLVLVALFIYIAAGAEAGLSRMRDVTDGMTAADLMVTELLTLPSHARIADAVEMLVRTGQQEFPILETNGQLLCILTRDGMISALHKGGDQSLAIDAADRTLASLAPRQGATRGIQFLQQGASAVPVIDGEGRLLGLITWDNLRDHMLVADAWTGLGARMRGTVGIGKVEERLAPR